MKNRKLTAREKRQARIPAAMTAEAIGLDPALYAAALRYLFDRPVPEKKEQEWYWNNEEPEFAATPLEWTRIQTVLFANAGADLAPYDNQQVGMGLNHVMSNNAGDIPHMANDPSVPLADAMQMMRAFPSLWRDCIGPRLESRRRRSEIPAASSAWTLSAICGLTCGPLSGTPGTFRNGEMRSGWCFARCWTCPFAKYKGPHCTVSATRCVTCSATKRSGSASRDLSIR